MVTIGNFFPAALSYNIVNGTLADSRKSWSRDTEMEETKKALVGGEITEKRNSLELIGKLFYSLMLH